MLFTEVSELSAAMRKASARSARSATPPRSHAPNLVRNERRCTTSRETTEPGRTGVPGGGFCATTVPSMSAFSNGSTSVTTTSSPAWSAAWRDSMSVSPVYTGTWIAVIVAGGIEDGSPSSGSSASSLISESMSDVSSVATSETASSDKGSGGVRSCGSDG